MNASGFEPRLVGCQAYVLGFPKISPNLCKRHLTLLTGARGWNCPSQTEELHLSHYYKKMETQKKGGSSLKPMAKAKAPTKSRNSCCHCSNASLPRNSSRTKGMIY